MNHPHLRRQTGWVFQTRFSLMDLNLGWEIDMTISMLGVTPSSRHCSQEICPGIVRISYIPVRSIWRNHRQISRVPHTAPLSADSGRGLARSPL